MIESKEGIIDFCWYSAIQYGNNKVYYHSKKMHLYLLNALKNVYEIEMDISIKLNSFFQTTKMLVSYFVTNLLSILSVSQPVNQFENAKLFCETNLLC